MMKVLIALAGFLVWAAPLMAETYSWVDENGTYNFTEDYSRVPKKYRKSVGKRGNMTSEPVQTESVSPTSGSKVVPGESSKNTTSGKPESSTGNFGGKSYDQWKQEFSEREAAMLAIRTRIDEIDAVVKSKTSDKEHMHALLSERSKLFEQFNELRKQYNQQVENARKAGITVNLK